MSHSLGERGKPPGESDWIHQSNLNVHIVIPTSPSSGAHTASRPAHLQNLLIVELCEDGACNLIGFQGHPVQEWHPELSLDGFLGLHSCGVGEEGEW